MQCGILIEVERMFGAEANERLTVLPCQAKLWYITSKPYPLCKAHHVIVGAPCSLPIIRAGQLSTTTYPRLCLDDLCQQHISIHIVQKLDNENVSGATSSSWQVTITNQFDLLEGSQLSELRASKRTWGDVLQCALHSSQPGSHRK
jgi:hypothetical protein